MTTEPDADPQPVSSAKNHEAMTAFDDRTLHIDFNQQEVTLDGKPVDLTPTEYRLLATLVRHRGQVLSPEELVDLAYEERYGWLRLGRLKFIMPNLRNKLGGDEREDQPIQTVQGGYQYR